MSTFQHTIDVKPLSALGKVAYYARDLASSVYRLAVRRASRTRQVVNAEYDGGAWARLLQSREWERHSDLKSFLVGNDLRPRICKIDGEIVRVPTRDYYLYRLGAMQNMINRLAGDGSEITELGAGFGYNLFSLYLGGRFDRLFGFDISENGIKAGNLIARQFNIEDRVSFDRLDLTDANDKNYSKMSGRVVFTYFCIEQIPRSVESVVANLIAARPARVIHIEPTVELLDLSQPRDLISYFYIKSVDYQTRLFNHLRDLERQGDVRIVEQIRMPFAPTIHNDGFVVAWEPVT